MNSEMSRREFLRNSSVVAAAGVLATKSVAADVLVPTKMYPIGKDTLKLGLIGCGGRGSGNVREALTGYKDAVLVAMGDAFEDELDRHLQALKGNAEISDRIQV